MVNLRFALSQVVLGVVVALAIACSPSKSSPAPAVTVGGDWQGSWNSNSGVSGTLTLHLVDTNGSVSGTMNVLGSPCGNQSTVTGSVTGYTVVISTMGADSMRFTATVQQNNPGAMSGTYSISTGGCQGDTGTFNITMPAQPVTVPTQPVPQTQPLLSPAPAHTPDTVDAG